MGTLTKFVQYRDKIILQTKTLALVYRRCRR